MDSYPANLSFGFIKIFGDYYSACVAPQSCPIMEQSNDYSSLVKL